ncbi:MAG: cation-translocating P-type ATPase [Clostridiales bacterium]|nr:cation-translocating P-type ATPase [Clostridiales bacterium]
MNYHALTVQRVLSSLETCAEGLTAFQAARRLERDGKNELERAKKKNLLLRFLAQFSDFTVIILLVAAVVSYAVSRMNGESELGDTAIILAIVTLNAVIGTFQESRAQHALEALEKLSAPTARVIRDGKAVSIKASEVVPGDIIELSAGDMIPADARLISSSGFKTDESALTGESLPCEKDAKAVLSEVSQSADMRNCVFSSSLAVSGRARAVVYATGGNTQVGKIASLLAEEDNEETPLQKRLSKVGKALAFGALLICAGIFALGVARGTPLNESFMLAVSLAVAAIPEGLPAIVTIVLSGGVGKMAKSNAIIRRLPAVETLGCATVICTDKTGTLTRNKMTVEKTYAAGSDEGRVLELGAVCCNCTVKSGRVSGEPTEAAIVSAAIKAGAQPGKYIREGELPFESSRKLMSVCVRTPDGNLQITKGAPDVLIPLCSRTESPYGVREFDAVRKNAAYGENDAFASQALRVIAVAYKPLGSGEKMSEKNLIFCGLTAMCDPPRKEAANAVAVCKQAGIIPVMITGDHLSTAQAVAARLGISEKSSTALDGHQLDAMSEPQLREAVKSCRVFARVSPEHKMRIVKAFKDNGEIAAMTGDGVNDAPALKAADIGCAMGKSGTQVAKGAADMILTDDNFATILKAVEIGRGLYDNIKKSVRFLISCNLGEIFTIFAATLAGIPAVLLPVQLLWLNLVTDSLPAMALGSERPDRDVMKRKPLSPSQGMFANGLFVDMLLEGGLFALAALIAYRVGGSFFDIPGQSLYARTMAFCVLSVSELIYAFSVRSDEFIIKAGIFSNKKMTAAFAVCCALQVSAVTVEPLCAVFKTVSLSLPQLGVCTAIAFIPFAAAESAKGLSALSLKIKRKPRSSDFVNCG